MIIETFEYCSFDNNNIFVYKWSPENTKILGIVHISHGLSEHAGRYKYFAEQLTSVGYIVYAHDQRGHGKTTKNTNNIVHISNGGWTHMQKDLVLLIDYIKKAHAELPIFLFGHSMGSFIIRSVLQDSTTNVNGAIISGTGCFDNLALNAGILVAKSLIKRRGPHKRSYYINNITFRAFNLNVSEPKTFFDWISRDDKIVSSFLNDPLCRINCSNNLFFELFNGLKTMQNPKSIIKTPKNTPILLLSGGNDPVGHWGRDVFELMKLYKNIGVNDVQYKLYPFARHELINETNKDEVILDIINWLNERTSPALSVVSAPL